MISGEYPPLQGGVGAYTQILSHKLADNGHEVFIYSSAQAQESDPRLHLDSSGKWNFTSVRQIERWVTKNRLDVVNIQYQTAAYGMSPYIHFIPNILRRAPVVTTFHDLRYPYLFPKAGRLRDWIVTHLARASDGAIATNHEDMQRLHSINIPCTSLIPIGSNILSEVPTDLDVSPWREKVGAQAGDFLIAFFGLINASKGLATLLNAFSELRNRGIAAKLVIIGDVGSSDPTNGTYAAHIRAHIQAQSLAESVHITGYLDEADVSHYLSAADCIALPFLDGASYRRGSLMAAIHYGCAIITTQPAIDIPALIDNENMLLVPVGDVTALSNALEKLYHFTELRDKLKHGAKALAMHFDWGMIARQTAAFFETVISRSAVT